MDWLGHRESLMIRHDYHMRQDEARRQMLKIPSLVESGPDPDGPGPDSGTK